MKFGSQRVQRTLQNGWLGFTGGQGKFLGMVLAATAPEKVESLVKNSSLAAPSPPGWTITRPRWGATWIHKVVGKK